MVFTKLKWLYMWWALNTPWWGNVNFMVTSPKTFLVSWNTNYDASWSVVSISCDHYPIRISENMNGTRYMYHMYSLMHNCDCLKEHSVVLRNEDLDIWVKFDGIFTNCSYL